MRFFLLMATLAWSAGVCADTAIVVEGTRVNLRIGTTDNARVIRSLQPGTRVEVVQQTQEYVQVKTAEGETGWLPARFLKLSLEPSASQHHDARIEALEAELAAARAALAQRPAPAPEGGSFWRMALIAAGAFILGIVLGIAGLEAYYRKRLNGLRI